MAFEASKQATLIREAELAKQQAIRDQAALAKERAEREKAAREQLARDREARERKEAERLASLRGQLKSKGWNEVGSSGLLFRWCNPSANQANLGRECSNTTSNRYWFGLEFYCLSTSCSGVIEGAFGDKGRYALDTFSHGYISFKPNQKRTLIFTQSRDLGDRTWLNKAAGYCDKDRYWRKC